MRARGKDVDVAGFTASPTAPIVITLGHTTASLVGTVRDQDWKAVAGSGVVLVPGSTTVPPAYLAKRTTSDQNGQFIFQDPRRGNHRDGDPAALEGCGKHKEMAADEHR